MLHIHACIESLPSNVFQLVCFVVVGFFWNQRKKKTAAWGEEGKGQYIYFTILKLRLLENKTPNGCMLQSLAVLQLALS